MRGVNTKAVVNTNPAHMWSPFLENIIMSPLGYFFFLNAFFLCMFEHSDFSWQLQ